MNIHLFAMAEINTPQDSYVKQLKKESLPLYELNKKDLFTAYSTPTGEYLFFGIDKRWYAGAHFIKNTLHGLKYGRQTFSPPYNDIPDEELSFIMMLERNGWSPAISHYDKAICHVVLEVDSIDEVPLNTQSRLAHADGDDDPQVAHSLHYIESLLNGKRSRFISGWESHSFATITESESFYENILLPVSSWLYILYYTHFIRNGGEIPSDQMMPRLLGNLWASTSKSIPYNEKLVRIQPLF
ncbi:hypothetical protein [Bacillus sp. NEB1478]|uniref:hypothetical protein n=1 Tax=Bacillus sp. NEB1478 TaxID=3073816 RepID=UPI00287314F4|nr:hypothetical protein [Bacillus sp. NEB1478]WNB90731.1 hypothetical protein RGB74_12490 [Bacillus sp. NEB1478]